MQLCNVRVNLAGSLVNTVAKPAVTVAEIIVLRAIHGGNDTVTQIQPIHMDRRSHAEEFARLCRVYGTRRVSELFPGANPQLPVNLADIGVEREREPEQPKGLSPQQRAAQTRAAKAAAAAAGETSEAASGDSDTDNDE
jgi:hypothetical protein